MKNMSIMIPSRDYKLIDLAIRKNRYPVEDPGLVGRVYLTGDEVHEVEAELINEAGKFFIHWTGYYLVDGKIFPLGSPVKRDNLGYVMFNDGTVAYFEIDPTYE